MKNKFDTYTKGFELILKNEIEPIDYLRIPRYNRKNIDVPARILNHWDKMGLLLKRNPLGATYSFSLTESFWIKFIQKLRAYNLPLELIKQLKDELCVIPQPLELMKNKDEYISYFKATNQSLSKIEIEQIFNSTEIIEQLNLMKPTLLENLLIDLIITRTDLRILINEKGEVFFYNTEKSNPDEEYNIALYKFMSNTYLNISLLEIIKELIIELGEDECSKNQNILTKEEATILKILKQEDIAKIEISFNDKTKKAETIKVTKKNSVTNLSRVQDLIIRNGYQDISIKTQNGKVVQCTNTIKYKLDTE
jgi:DNA-binding transcriptional MerR regulator